MRKWVGGILGAVILILLAASCAPRYFCSCCGKIFSGAVYWDAGGEKIFCRDCAARYYSPLIPKGDDRSKGRRIKGRSRKMAAAAGEAGRRGRMETLRSGAAGRLGLAARRSVPAPAVSGARFRGKGHALDKTEG